MPRSKKRALRIRVQAVSLPKSVKPELYLKRLIQSLDAGEPLPRGWQVNVHWINPETMVGSTANWQVGEFFEVIQDSNDSWGPGFSTVLRDILVSKLLQVRFR